MGLRDKRLWLPLILGAIAALVALVFVVSGFVGGRDYTGVPVADLPLEEQIRIARCVRLSSIVNWGEGGNLYCRQVVGAFLLDYPYPDFLDKKYGRFELFSPWERERDAIAFLVQSAAQHHHRDGLPRPQNMAYGRTIQIYTADGIYSIHLALDNRGRILHSGSTFAPYRR